MKDLLGDICGILGDFGGRERATQKERRGKERERARKRLQRERARLVPTSQSKEEGGNIQSPSRIVIDECSFLVKRFV